VLEFFTAQINNDHTRKAYLAAARHFADWCRLHGIAQLEDVRPFHVAAFVKDMEDHVATPTVKQHLAANNARCPTHGQPGAAANRTSLGAIDLMDT
jgi:hypothetical protein